MSVAINGTDGITYNDGSLQPSAPVGKNLIINGDMKIAQRATNVTGITGQGYYTVDRWKQQLSGGGTYTQSQTALTSSDASFSDGFSQSIKYDCTTAYTGVDSFAVHRQVIEGQNLQRLAYGTSSAKSLTLSFWVKSNVTGTAVASIYSVDSNKYIGQTYTIDTANTWEYKTITFVGDTTSIIDNDANGSFYVNLVMATGTDYTTGTLPSTWTTYANENFAAGQTIDISANTSNDISFTGIQLEANTTATPFEHLQYGQQLALCQRYYYKWNTTSSNNWVAWAMAANTTNMYGHVPFPTTMRNNPSSIEYSGLGWWLGGAVTAFSSVAIAESGTDSCTMNFTSTGLTAQKMYAVLPNGSTNYIAFNSEL